MGGCRGGGGQLDLPRVFPAVASLPAPSSSRCSFVQAVRKKNGVVENILRSMRSLVAEWSSVSAEEEVGHLSTSLTPDRVCCASFGYLLCASRGSLLMPSPLRPRLLSFCPNPNEQYKDKAKKSKEKGECSTDAIQARNVGPNPLQLALLRLAVKVWYTTQVPFVRTKVFASAVVCWFIGPCCVTCYLDTVLIAEHNGPVVQVAGAIGLTSTQVHY
jgi:hypothetical protein